MAIFAQNVLAPVRAWALANVSTFLPNGVGRQYAPLHLFSDVPEEIWTIKHAIIERFHLQYAPQEPVYRDLCSVITNGGAVHRHMDPNQGRLIHTRFNVMVSKPLTGGEPIIDDQTIDVPEGGIYRVDAGIKMHGCNMVGGAKPRIILSFGFLCHA